MKIIQQSAEFEVVPNGTAILEQIERAGRTCYKSEAQITEASSKTFIHKIIKSGHHSVLEHVSISARFITDRGVTHEIVRHRIASYSQESTRYCNYSKDRFGKEITVILPVWLDMVKNSELPQVIKNIRFGEYLAWERICKYSEKGYFELLDKKWKPEQARSVLPNSLKTEIVMTANLREWRHFFSLRAARPAHPQMRELAHQALRKFLEAIPIVFDEYAPLLEIKNG